MSALGDILYRAASLWTALAGNITTTKKFLTQTGTGAVSAIPAWGQVNESDVQFTDITTGNVSSTKHGYAPKSPADATQFLNGATTNAYAAVKDSDLSTSDITTNNLSTSKHGFAPKAPNDVTKFLDGTGAFSVPSGSGAGSEVLISRITTAASQSTFQFAAIPATYKHLRLRFYGKGDAATTAVDFRIRFNADTGNHYDWEEWHRLGSGSGVADPSMKIGGITAATGYGGYPALLEALIMDYKGTTFNKGVISYLGLSATAVASGLLFDTVTGWWTTGGTAAITQIDGLLSSGNFVNGSIIELWGIF